MIDSITNRISSIHQGTTPPRAATAPTAPAAGSDFAGLLDTAVLRSSPTDLAAVDPTPTATIGAMLAAASGSVVPPALLADLVVGAGPAPTPGAGSTDLTLTGDMDARRAALAPVFAEAGARHGIDPALLEAVAWTESGFQPDAVSPAGAIGLMQIMPGTAEGLGVDPRDPVQAIDGAARYLRDAMDQFGDIRLALAAYNAGPGAVASHGGIPPYPETQAYVVKVLDRFDTLRGAAR